MDLTFAELLAEPQDPRSPHWMSATYARLLALAGPRPLGPSPCSTRTARSWGSWGRPPDLPDPRAVGSSRPALVLVGESPPAAGQRAFLSRSGHWLLRALRVAGWDELEVLLTNACEVSEVKSRTGKRRTDVMRALYAWLAPVGPTWVALGRTAGEVLAAAGIACVRCEHPAHHQRFTTAAGPAGFAELLLAAGMPAGPWRGKELPAVAHADARTALADRFGLPKDVAWRKGRPPREVAADSAGTPGSKREEARRLFVTGEVPTIKAATEKLGCSYDDLGAIAREERWVEQRDRHAREIADRAIREAGRAEAKAIAVVRRLAWSATQLALGSIVKRLQALGDGALVPEIREAAALVASARSLTEMEGPVGAPTERPIADLVRDAKRMLKEIEEEGEE